MSRKKMFVVENYVNANTNASNTITYIDSNTSISKVIDRKVEKEKIIVCDGHVVLWIHLNYKTLGLGFRI